MYKVFVNENVIILTNKIPFGSKINLFDIKKISLIDIVSNVKKHKNIAGINKKNSKDISSQSNKHNKSKSKSHNSDNTNRKSKVKIYDIKIKIDSKTVIKDLKKTL